MPKMFYEMDPWLVCFQMCFFFLSALLGVAPCVGTIGMVHMTPTLDAALLCGVHCEGVTTTSSKAGTNLGWLLDVDHRT